MFERYVKSWFDKYIQNNKILILYGPRQSGKTTFLKHYISQLENAILINCEAPEFKEDLNDYKASKLRMIFGSKKIIVLDEAQSIENIGNLLKFIFDEDALDYKVIATGSSSFYLSDKVQEPLTGRNLVNYMFPLSFIEILENRGYVWWKYHFEEILIYGSYPGIIELSTDEKKNHLFHLASDYLYKDILNYERIKNSLVLNKLLKALAWQVGGQVSYNEIAQHAGVSQPTVIKYLDLLEKSFVIFKLGSFSRNLRNELKKSNKYYFWDNGILNAIINDFSTLESRKDKGAMWENYCIAERKKMLLYQHPEVESYFWRTYDKSEVDYIEVKDQKIEAYEFKYSKKAKSKISQTFLNEYNPVHSKIITKDNVYEFLK